MATYKKRGTAWQAEVRRKGHKRVCATFDTKAQAEAWAAQVEAAMVTNKWIDTRGWDDVTLTDALDRYRDEITAKKKSISGELARVRRWQRSDLAKRPIGRIRSHDLAKIRNARLAEGASQNTVRLELALLSHLYTVATKEWGFDVENPVAKLTLPPPGKGRDRRLLDGEETRLLEAAMAEGVHREMHDIIVVAIETAMRRGEIVKLRRQNIRGRVALIPDTKNGEDRRVPLSTRAAETIARQPAHMNGKVFQIYLDDISREFCRIAEAAGCADLHFHDLRHEATSRFFERGLGIMEVASITGHKDLKMLKRYTHMIAEDLARKLG